MPVERRLLHETITYSDAKDIEVNILHQLGHWSQQNASFSFMRVRRNLIEAHVAHQLRVHPTKCHAADVDDLVQGSFNLGIPVTVEGFGRIIIRFPLAYRVGERFFPGNSAEKVKCEAGTYAWMQQYCPTVPIPRLHGFVLSTGQFITAYQFKTKGENEKK